MMREHMRSYTEDLSIIIFQLVGLTKYFYVMARLSHFGSLFKLFSDLKLQKSANRSKEDQNVIKRILQGFLFTFFAAALIPTVMFVMGYEYEKVLMYPFVGELYSPFVEIASSLAAIAGTLCAFATIAIQISFYSLCVDTKILYELMFEDLLELNDEKKDPREILKKSVEFHMTIKNAIDVFRNEFHFILILDSILYMISIGMFSFNASFSFVFIRTASGLLLAFFSTWSICNGGNIIIEQSRETAVKIYTELKWYNIKSVSIRRSLIIIMMECQKANPIRLLNLKSVDSELFIFVSLLRI